MELSKLKRTGFRGQGEGFQGPVGCGSAVQHVLSMLVALGSNLRTTTPELLKPTHILGLAYHN